jgi:hypothetical protein
LEKLSLLALRASKFNLSNRFSKVREITVGRMLALRGVAANSKALGV